MRFNSFITLLLLTIPATLFCQGFNVNTSDLQTFYFKDPQNRNQITFTSDAFFETFTGLSSDVWGEVSFNPSDVKNTLKGEVSISVNSITTGIDMRDENLKSDGWLDSEKFPIISFRIEKVEELTIVEDNKIRLSIVGSFDCRGRVREVMLEATLIFLEENNMTKKRMPGDLLSVVADFSIDLSDYDIRSIFIPDRVSDKISIAVNIVGSNAKP